MKINADNRNKEMYWIPLVVPLTIRNGKTHYVAQGYRCFLCHGQVRNKNAKGTTMYRFCPYCGAKALGHDDSILEEMNNQ